MKLIIEDDEGRKTVVPFVREEITIGRQEGNTIRLTERNVSRRHARLLRQNGHVLVEDLGSYNGIRINGERISGQVQVQDGDLIQIGDYDLAIQSEAAAQAAAQAAAAAPAQPPQKFINEPETEADAPVVTPDGRLEDYEEDTSPSPQDLAARRQSTSIIRADQLEDSRPKREVVDLDPEEAPRLIVLNSNYAGREFACIRTELRIGRTDDNDIALDHRSLSRTHAKVVRESDGDWRVIDMQSANGLRVNGEGYAQATLRSGDVIELGHVKLKFVGPGEAFRFTPGAYDEPQEEAPRGSNKKVFLIAGLVVLLVGVAAVAMMSRGRTPATTPTDPPRPQVHQGPEKEGNGAGQETAAHPSPPPPTEAPAVQQANLEQKISAAKDAMAAHEFDKAVDILESVKGPDGVRPKEAAELLAKARSELEAQKSPQGGTTPDPQAADPAPANEGKQGEQVARNSNNPQEQANKLLAEGSALLKKKQYRQAIDQFNKCLLADPSMAKCHLKLGVTYASMKEYDKGAAHYKAFLKLAPEDPKAPEIRGILEAYEKQQ